jgi:hypothetical protein
MDRPRVVDARAAHDLRPQSAEPPGSASPRPPSAPLTRINPRTGAACRRTQTRRAAPGSAGTAPELSPGAHQAPELASMNFTASP